MPKRKVIYNRISICKLSSMRSLEDIMKHWDAYTYSHRTHLAIGEMRKGTISLYGEAQENARAEVRRGWIMGVGGGVHGTLE